MVRMNLVVGDDVPDKLSDLAESPRKRGEFLTRLIRELHASQVEATRTTDLEGLRLQLLGLAGQVKGQDARLLQVERTLAALMAEGAKNG